MRVEDGCFYSNEDANGGRYFLHHLANGFRSEPDHHLRSGPELKRTNADTLHAVYSALQDRLTLSDDHRNALHFRGLTDAAIDLARYRTLPGPGRTRIVRNLHELFQDKLLHVPGFVVKVGESGPYVTLRGPTGLLVPCRDRTSRIIALKVRLDEADGGRRYLYVSSVGHGGPGPGSPVHCPLGMPEAAKLGRVTEGELKADVVQNLTGLPTISIPGVSNWRPALEVLIELGWKTARLAFDADCRETMHVARSLSSFADSLVAAGIRVELERWNLADGKGLDDLLFAGKVPELVSGDQAMSEIRDILATATAGKEQASLDQIDERPAITITTDEHLINDEAVAALTREQSVYQRMSLLVRIVRDISSIAKGIRRPLAPRIDPLPPALLRERLAANARWFSRRETNEGVVEKPARPPAWCVAAIHARAAWAGIRHLESVVEYPVLRPDGTILDLPGYDSETGLVLEPAGQVPEIPSLATRADAINARNKLLEVVSDFPFERPIHRAAWLASLLTPLARFAFTGPSPLFLVDANVPAAGKGLLLDTTSQIITGERFTIATYTKDEDELRKRITSLVLAGDRLVLLDNLEGRFGNGVLDAALTGTIWKDRVLGGNRIAEAPLNITWFATGNNVAIVGDTPRRICHCRLESSDERPEERSGFRHPDLLAWVKANRGRLLGAALTILRAYSAAGSPDMGLPAWGSFEGWSRLVRSAVVWIDLPDPGETRLLLKGSADVVTEYMSLLVECWEQMDPERRGLTAAEVIQMYKQPPEPRPGWHGDLMAALEGLIGKPDTQRLGTKLRAYRRRIFGIRFMDRAGESHRAVRWAVFPVTDFHHRSSDTRPHSSHSPKIVSVTSVDERGSAPATADSDSKAELDFAGTSGQPPAAVGTEMDGLSRFGSGKNGTFSKDNSEQQADRWGDWE